MPKSNPNSSRVDGWKREERRIQEIREWKEFYKKELTEDSSQLEFNFNDPRKPLKPILSPRQLKIIRARSLSK